MWVLSADFPTHRDLSEFRGLISVRISILDPRRGLVLLTAKARANVADCVVFARWWRRFGIGGGSAPVC